MKQEIASIWETINRIVSNTQDYVEEVRSEIINTPTDKEHLSTSMTQEKLKNTCINPSPKVRSDVKSKTELDLDEINETEAANDIQIIVKEIKDDVHNQIIEVKMKAFIFLTEFTFF